MDQADSFTWQFKLTEYRYVLADSEAMRDCLRDAARTRILMACRELKLDLPHEARGWKMPSFPGSIFSKQFRLEFDPLTDPPATSEAWRKRADEQLAKFRDVAAIEFERVRERLLKDGAIVKACQRREGQKARRHGESSVSDLATRYKWAAWRWAGRKTYRQIAEMDLARRRLDPAGDILGRAKQIEMACRPLLLEADLR